VWVAIGAVLAM
jgi:hypothetical protein